MMSNENLLVKDLPEAERAQIIKAFGDLGLSGVPYKMLVSDAKSLIEKKKSEKQTVQNQVQEAVSGQAPDTIPAEDASEEAKSQDDSQKDIIKELDKNPEIVQAEVPKRTRKKSEKESDGKCVICHAPVYAGVCSGCKTRFGGY